jgi:hypothetical protein
MKKTKFVTFAIITIFLFSFNLISFDLENKNLISAEQDSLNAWTINMQDQAIVAETVTVEEIYSDNSASKQGWIVITNDSGQVLGYESFNKATNVYSIQYIIITLSTSGRTWTMSAKLYEDTDEIYGNGGEVLMISQDFDIEIGAQEETVYYNSDNNFCQSQDDFRDMFPIKVGPGFLGIHENNNENPGIMVARANLSYGINGKVVSPFLDTNYIVSNDSTYFMVLYDDVSPYNTFDSNDLPVDLSNPLTTIPFVAKRLGIGPCLTTSWTPLTNPHLALPTTSTSVTSQTSTSSSTSMPTTPQSSQNTDPTSSQQKHHPSKNLKVNLHK